MPYQEMWLRSSNIRDVCVFLKYPEADTTPLSIAWANRRRIPLLRSLLHSSGNAASIPTATAGCGCGYREFYTNKPNSKWVTDISYIHTKQGVLYLSMICDLYDNSIVAYKTGSGHEAGEKDSRCGVAAPQRPGLSIHVTSIFPAN